MIPDDYFDEGAVVNSRRVLYESIFANPFLFKMWFYFICKANFKDKWVSLKIGKGYTEVLVKRGQFIFGRNKDSEFLGFKPSQTYTMLGKLTKLGYISVESNNQYSVVTILNYNEMQELNNYKPTTNRQPTDNQKHN